LRELGAKFAARSGIAVDYRFSPDLPSLSSDVELTLYRVAQESLTNVARHAGARQVVLSLSARHDGAVLEIVDDGDGFDTTAVGIGAGGIRGMRERAVLVGGSLAVMSAPRSGTEIRLRVPALAN
jgi:two-component system sensor histidine kinase UhpB